jgi:hypothetical protein
MGTMMELPGESVSNAEVLAALQAGYFGRAMGLCRLDGRISECFKKTSLVT